MASSIIAQHHTFFADDAPHRVHSFEPFETHPDDNLYTSPPSVRDTSTTYQRNTDSPPLGDDLPASASAFLHQNPPVNHQSMNNPLYQQPDTLDFRGPLDFSSNPFQTSTSFSSSNRSRQQAGGGSNGGLSHQSSVSALYGPDVGFEAPPPSDIFAPLQPSQNPQRQQHDYLQRQSSHLQLNNGFSDNIPYEQYDFDPTARGIRHQTSFGGQANRGIGQLNGGNGVAGGEPSPLAPASSAAYNGNGVNNSTIPSYTNTTSGPTLRETLRDAREPRDSSVDARGGSGRDGGPGASGSGNGQEEISTIFVVGFPDDMQEREFQNMFTFSRGFEAATLKIPNKDSTAYSGAANPSLNASTSASSISNASNSSNERRGTITGASYGGASDPYNLVTVNSGGVVVDSRDLPGGTQTSAVWPGGLLPGSASSSTDDHSTSIPAGTAQPAAIGGPSSQSQAQQPPRKQIIGFAKFATRADALYARDVLQSKRIDIEKSAVLKAEMAKKNLHTKRGVGGAQGNSGAPNPPPQQEAAGPRGGLSSRDTAPSGMFTTSSGMAGNVGSGIPLVNGNGAIGPMGALSQGNSNGNKITNDLHHSYALSVREREQAVLAAMGVSSTIGGHRGFGSLGPDFSESDYLEERMGEHQYRHHDLFPRRSEDHYQHSVSVSGGSSVSSFSPESAPASRNIPMPQHGMNRIDFEGRIADDLGRGRAFDVGTGMGDKDANATPVANLAGWPAHLQQREFEDYRERPRFDLEPRARFGVLEDRDGQNPSSRSTSPSLPLSGSALRSRISEENFGEREAERDIGSSSFDSGVGDSTVIAPDRAESRTVVQEEPEWLDNQGSRVASPQSTSPHGSSPREGQHQSILERLAQQSEQPDAPQSSGLASENQAETFQSKANDGESTSHPSNAGPWPRPPSSLSVSSHSGRSSVVRDSPFSVDRRLQDHLQQRSFGPPQPQQRSFDSSSRGSGSPPDMNELPDVMPSHYEEDERDQISPLHQQGPQSLHQHLPLNHLPRHQLPQQYTQFQPQQLHRMQDTDRNNLHFNEAIFDARGGGGRRSQNDLAALDARFNDFSLGAGGGILRETSPPLSSPPLAPMAANPGRGSTHNDIRANIDQNPPINTLYVGNLPTTSSSSATNAMLEENLRQAFQKCPGYRKLCFRQKSNGPMCFVEFEDVHYAAKALNDMYGHTLNGLIKNGIRLSYSKNPLGVRSPSMSNGSGLNTSLPSGSGFHDLHNTQSGRHASMDGGRFASSKGSFYVDSNAPPRRQQLREENLQDSRVISNPFDGTVIGPRSMRQMSLGPGVGIGSLGEYVNGGGAGGGLGALQEHSFGMGALNNNGPYMPPATSPPPRLAPRYFSAAPGDGIPSRSALSPILSPSSGSASSAFGGLSGLGGNYNSSSDMVSPHQQAQPLVQQQQAPLRSSFSPFRNDMFIGSGGGSDPRFDERDRFERNDSLIGHFGSGLISPLHDGGGFSATLYNSNTFAPLGGNSGGEQR